jgi:hypothetical protein
MAQGKVEVSGIFGWTFSDGVTGSAVNAPDGHTYNAVDLKDSMNWGLMFGVMANDNFEVGFMFNQQPSKLRLEGTTSKELGLPRRHALDPDLHQERPGRLVVRLLRLLHDVKGPVREPVRFLGRRHNSVLTRRKP